MIKGFKKYALLTAVCAMTVTGLAGCGKDIDGTAAAAVCNDENIPMGVASLMARYQQAQMYSFYSSYFGGGNVFDTVADEESGDTYGETMKDDTMEALEGMYLLRQHAGDYDITISGEDKTKISEAAKSFVEANDSATLETMGVSQSDVETLLELYTYQTRMREVMIANVDKEVSDEEAARSKVTYAAVSLAGTETDEEGNIIELTDEEKADKEEQAGQILEKVQAAGDAANVDMDALAKEVDENLTATSSTFGSDSETPDAAIREAVEGLADGTLVDHVVTSEDGTRLYVVRFDAVLDREATDARKASIITEREQKDFDDELKEWTDAADFDVKSGVWKKLTINDAEVYTFKAVETPAAE